MNRVREGFCTVPNPFNAKQISRVSFRPGDVDALVFWTRDPSPIVSCVRELEERGLPCFFLVTILNYPRVYEPRSRDVSRVIRAFRELSSLLGRGRLAWRYDPIILSDGTNPDFHRRVFSDLAKRLSGASSRCIVSVLDLYRGVERAFRTLDETYRPWSGERLRDGLAELVPFLSEEAGRWGFSVQSCAEERDLSSMGVSPGACIDPEWLSTVTGHKIPAVKDPNQRLHCLCARARDIGVYGTCPFGCLYCYATKNQGKALEAMKVHDPHAPSLVRKPVKG